MLGNVNIDFLSHANFVQCDLILRSFLLVLFCFFLFHRKRNACSHVHHLSQVGVGKWILPDFDQGLQFSGCYLFTLRVDATESLIRKEYSPIICTTRPSLPLSPDFILLVSQVIKKVKQNAGTENFSANMWMLLLLAFWLCSSLNLEDEVLYTNSFSQFT